LARCYLETGHLHDAAAQYERFLRAELLSSLPQWKVEVYKRLSAIYEKIGDTEEAIEYLARCASEFAKEPGIHRKMAEMLVDRGDYRSAYECLLKETEVTPDLEKDLGVRVALALGALQDSSDRSDQASKFLDSHPPIKSLIDSMLTAYWPRFAKLGSQSQSEWRSGICEMYVFAPLVPEDRCRRDENAVKHFAKVVELELRTRVFDEYRKQFPGGNRDLNLPSPGRDQWLRNLDHFLAGRGQLNLEKMTNILVSLSYSRDPVAQRFQAWLQQKSRRLLMKVQVLEQICKPRGDATHKEMTSNVAESVAQWCREILDSLLSVSP
jgi:tetratricopeptide (TPR) repeat protein